MNIHIKPPRSMFCYILVNYPAAETTGRLRIAYFSGIIHSRLFGIRRKIPDEPE